MNMKKVALITGITGQDGSFLAEFLSEKGYEVHGILRRSSSFNTGRIEHLYLDEWVRDMKKDRLINLHYGDMTDSSSLIRIIQLVQPDEIYNLAAQSHVKVSFDVPEYTAESDAVGTLRMLEAVRILGLEKKTKIYQASTSELFGKVQEIPQKEEAVLVFPWYNGWLNCTMEELSWRVNPEKVLLSPFTFRKINLYIAVKNCLEEKRTQTINGYTLRMRTTYISVMKKKPIQKAKKMRIQINEEHSLWWKTIKN